MAPLSSSPSPGISIPALKPPRLAFTEAPDCLVGLSRIHGEGLFARRNFRSGEVVCNYAASFEKWRLCLYKDIPDSYMAQCWFVGVSETECRLGDPESVFMRCNHSRDANCLWLPLEHTLVANRYIPAGTEITDDYRLDIAPPAFKAAPPPWA